jgi:hypothetical protein
MQEQRRKQYRVRVVSSRWERRGSVLACRRNRAAFTASVGDREEREKKQGSPRKWSEASSRPGDGKVNEDSDVDGRSELGTDGLQFIFSEPCQ